MRALLYLVTFNFVDAILGLDFIDLHNCVIDCKNKVLFFWLENISVDLQHAGETRETNFVRLATTQKIVVSPESEMEIMVRPVSDQGVEEGMWMVENDRAKSHGVCDGSEVPLELSAALRNLMLYRLLPRNSRS